MMIIIRTNPKDNEDSIYDIQNAFILNSYLWENKKDLMSCIKEYIDFEEKKGVLRNDIQDV